jgi:N-acylglucosamine-6-phosphate 2-epimerase
MNQIEVEGKTDAENVSAATNLPNAFSRQISAFDFELWRGGLIVSCQAPSGSPLARPEIIAAFAKTAELNGAIGVRIDGPGNIKEVRNCVNIPILGIYKTVKEDSDVYITPTFEVAKCVIEAGADIVAIDGTFRTRPNGEDFCSIVRRVREDLKRPTMADVATFDEGVYAFEQAGVDCVSTTLSGYTPETKHLIQPDFNLVERLAKRLSVPLICEGRLRSPDDVRRAFDCGAFAVVVGNAITSVDWLVREYVAVTPKASGGNLNRS